MTIKYNREELIATVEQEIENVMLQYENDNKVTDVDIRLQLVDGTYHINIGDSQFDTDHRGNWGYGNVYLKSEGLNKFPEQEIRLIATDIVDEALEDWEQNNKILKDIDDEFHYKL